MSRLTGGRRRASPPDRAAGSYRCWAARPGSEHHTNHACAPGFGARVIPDRFHSARAGALGPRVILFRAPAPRLCRQPSSALLASHPRKPSPGLSAAPRDLVAGVRQSDLATKSRRAGLSGKLRLREVLPNPVSGAILSDGPSGFKGFPDSVMFLRVARYPDGSERKLLHKLPIIKQLAKPSARSDGIFLLAF